MFLPIEIKEEIKTHALMHPSEEVCGVLYEIPDGIAVMHLPNISSEKQHSFLISPYDYLQIEKSGRKIIAVYHSHVNNNCFSEEFDIKASKSHNLPYILYCIRTNSFKICYPADKIESRYHKYLGRKFSLGTNDCFTLIKDFYDKELGINILHTSYNNLWYHENPNRIQEEGIKQGFQFLSPETKKQLHDILLFQDKSYLYPRHFGIYLGNNKFLHHPIDCPSLIDKFSDYKLDLMYIIRKSNE